MTINRYLLSHGKLDQTQYGSPSPLMASWIRHNMNRLLIVTVYIFMGNCTLNPISRKEFTYTISKCGLGLLCFALDLATTACFLFFQLTRLPPRNVQYPVVDLLWDGSSYPIWVCKHHNMRITTRTQAMSGMSLEILDNSKDNLPCGKRSAGLKWLTILVTKWYTGTNNGKIIQLTNQEKIYIYIFFGQMEIL